MNLLYTLTAYLPYIGGAQLHQHMLAQLLSARHEVQVVSHWDSRRTDWLLGTTIFAPSQPGDYVVDGIKVHRLGLSLIEKLRIAPYIPLYYPLMGLALPPIARGLEQHLDPYAAQVDLIHNVRIGREGLSYASLQAARKRNIPFVLTPVHHPRWKGWRYRAYNRLYQLAEAIVALTYTEKQTLISLGIDENRITVTGTGPILSSEARPTEFIENNGIAAPFVLFIGQHYPYKGYKQILQAAKFVWKKMPEAEFVFIGPTVKESERDFIAFQDRRIHRLGRVDLQTKTDALAACTVFCMPSTQESFGIVYTEAWSFGKPVIGCNIPAVAEVIEDGVNGYLVEQEPADIAEKIIYLLLNSSTAGDMGMAGKVKVDERFNWQRIAQITEQVYMSLW